MQLGGGLPTVPTRKRLLIQREPDFASLDIHFLQAPQLLPNPELLKGPIMVTRKSLRVSLEKTVNAAKGHGARLHFFSQSLSEAGPLP